MDNHCDGIVHVFDITLHKTARGCRLSGCHRCAVAHGCLGHEGSIGRILIGFCGSHRCVVRRIGRTSTYGCVTMDCTLSVRNSKELLSSGCTIDVARRSTQFCIEQHNSGGFVRGHREDVGKETEHRPFKTAHTIELRFRNGRCVYPHWYTSEPHHIRTLCY